MVAYTLCKYVRFKKKTKKRNSFRYITRIQHILSPDRVDVWRLIENEEFRRSFLVSSFIGFARLLTVFKICSASKPFLLKNSNCPSAFISDKNFL